MWRLDKGTLWYGEGTWTDNVSNYVDVIFKCPGDIDGMTKLLNPTIKVSKDGKFCAVIINGLSIVNIYGCYEFNLDNKPCVRGKFLSSLRYNRYRPSNEIIFEWVESVSQVTSPEGVATENREQLFIFNDKHGQLGLFRPDGTEVHHSKPNDMFLTELTWCDSEYFMLGVWWWHPFYAKILYKVSDFVSTPDYESKIIIDEDEREDINLVCKILDADQENGGERKIKWYESVFSAHELYNNFPKCNLTMLDEMYAEDLTSWPNHIEGFIKDTTLVDDYDGGDEYIPDYSFSHDANNPDIKYTADRIDGYWNVTINYPEGADPQYRRTVKWGRDDNYYKPGDISPDVTIDCRKLMCAQVKTFSSVLNDIKETVDEYFRDMNEHIISINMCRNAVNNHLKNHKYEYITNIYADGAKITINHESTPIATVCSLVEFIEIHKKCTEDPTYQHVKTIKSIGKIDDMRIAETGEYLNGADHSRGTYVAIWVANEQSKGLSKFQITEETWTTTINK